jgi:hypothetical protein
VKNIIIVIIFLNKNFEDRQDKSINFGYLNNFIEIYKTYLYYVRISFKADLFSYSVRHNIEHIKYDILISILPFL